MIRDLQKNRAGFSAVEMVITMVVLGILVSIAVRSLGTVRDSSAVRSAVNTFTSMHGRARAHAVERGETVLLMVDAGGDSVWISAGGDRLEIVRFAEQGIDITASSSPLRLCMTPRGYADDDCNSFSSEAKLNFASGTEGQSVGLLPLGQLVR